MFLIIIFQPLSSSKLGFGRLSRVSMGIMRHRAVGSCRLMSSLSDVDISPIHSDGIHSIQFQVYRLFIYPKIRIIDGHFSRILSGGRQTNEL